MTRLVEDDRISLVVEKLVVEMTFFFMAGGAAFCSTTKVSEKQKQRHVRKVIIKRIQ